MCCVYYCVYSVWHRDRPPEAGGGPEDTAGGLSTGGRSLTVQCGL